MLRTLSLIAGMALASAATASDGHSHSKPYAGQENRQISTLSEADIAALEAGQGWGLALPAELNGYPGPLHLLELVEEIELTAEQIAEVESVFKAMRTEAMTLGRQYLEAERAVDRLFKAGDADRDTLQAALQVSSDLRMALRQVHLNAHLAVTPLLTQHQRHTYAMLRGYGDGHGHHKGHGSHKQ